MSKEEILELQTKMKEMGFYNGSIDGLWGPKSEAAYKEYSISNEGNINLSIAWSAKVSKEFVERVVAMCERLKMDSNGANYMMACMAWETGETFSPKILNGAGSGACVDIETEILTKYGWKKYNEVNVGDPIYSINYSENKMEIDEILNLTIKESNDNYKMTSRSFDSLSSHDHRWYLKQNFYCRTDNSSEIKVKTSEEMFNLKSSYTYSIPHPSFEYIDTVTETSKLNKKLLTLIGLIVGDGSISKQYGKIELVAHVRGNVGEIDLIEDCLLNVFPDDVVAVDETKSGPGLFRWRFNKKQSDLLIKYFDVEYNSKLEQSRFIKKLNPDIFNDLDFSSAKAILKGYLYSDGHFCKSNNTVSFKNCEKAVLDDFMHVAVLCGENPRMVETKREGRIQKFPSGKMYFIRDIYTVYLRDAKYTSCAHHQLEKEKITDNITVWCPTTKNQNWIARRNGTVYITGNCGLIQFMPKTAIGLGTTVEELAKMSAEDQLVYVEKHFKPFKGKLKTLADVYSTIIYPKAVGKPDDYVLFSGGTIAYRQNMGIDINKNGKCTKEEAAAKVMQKYNKGMLPQNRRVI